MPDVGDSGIEINPENGAQREDRLTEMRDGSHCENENVSNIILEILLLGCSLWGEMDLGGKYSFGGMLKSSLWNPQEVDRALLVR